jgi:isocitrate/isopropylmalate dehydrogenase
MATLNVWIVENEGSTAPGIDEALSILRWAADAGPFSLAIERTSFAPSTTEDSTRLAQRAMRADAIWIDPRAFARPEFAQGLRRAVGVEAHLRAVKLDPAWIEASPLQARIATEVDLALLRAERQDAGAKRFDLFDAPLPTLQRFAKTACDIAARRSGRLTRLQSHPAGADESLWSHVLAEAARQAGIAMQATPTERFTAQLLADPRAFDVVIAEDRLGAMVIDQAAVMAGPHELAPSAYIGRRGILYEPGTRNAADDPIADVCAAILTMSMMLELSAARFGLAHTVRESLGRVLGDVGKRRQHRAAGLPPWQVGQAVIEHLEAGFRMCASF